MFTLGSTVYDYLLDQTGIVIANPDDATKIRVQFVNPETNKADRVGIKLVETEGKVKRVRVFKSNGAEIGA